ncbi:sugar transferase [Brevundimonas sp.]|uniref:sugar transferase n=2 Tax=Brevundimonas sp. TaxID=1871086 RepID=UPI0027EA61B4|nr:sugar transferase [Brevundimonas sp.]MDQ7813021.1 sugar transferase [Brevundimonas sp.]
MSMAAKRLLDMIVASGLLVVSTPVIGLGALLVWAHDRQDPLYRQIRIGKDGAPFQLFKLRSMSAAEPGATSDTTGHNDPRITPVGSVLRKTKIDELPQLWNVLRGDMSLVGPRPQVPREVAQYTRVEHGLLRVRPGVTDYASIVYSDLGDIVAGAADPDIAYSQLVRPGKSRLGLFYVEKPSVLTDLAILCLTAAALIHGPFARAGVAALLQRLGADPSLVEVAARRKPLTPAPPPGADAIVTTRAAQPAK